MIGLRDALITILIPVSSRHRVVGFAFERNLKHNPLFQGKIRTFREHVGRSVGSTVKGSCQRSTNREETAQNTRQVPSLANDWQTEKGASVQTSSFAVFSAEQAFLLQNTEFQRFRANPRGINRNDGKCELMVSLSRHLHNWVTSCCMISNHNAAFVYSKLNLDSNMMHELELYVIIDFEINETTPVLFYHKEEPTEFKNLISLCIWKHLWFLLCISGEK